MWHGGWERTVTTAPIPRAVINVRQLIMRPSSLGGAALCVALCLSVCPSVCPSVPLSLPSVTSRHLANYNDTHVLSACAEGRISYGHLGRTNSCLFQFNSRHKAHEKKEKYKSKYRINYSTHKSKLKQQVTPSMK